MRMPSTAVAVIPPTPVKTTPVERRGRYHRTAASIRKQKASRRRNALAAARAGRPYGNRLPAPRRGAKGGKTAPRLAHAKGAGGARLSGAGEASAYLREASRRALALVSGGLPQVAVVLGLIELARESLGSIK